MWDRPVFCGVSEITSVCPRQPIAGVQHNDHTQRTTNNRPLSTLLSAQYLIFLSIQGDPQFVLATKHQQDRVRNL